LLLTFYGERPLDRYQEEDRKTLKACEQIEETLAVIEDLPPQLAPKVSGADALRLVQRELEGQLLIDPPGEKHISLLGWLDLPWDDAPALVVLSLNEGIVPSSRSPDAFLPNSLRREMELDDNDRRYARDAYALSLLAASRRELRLVVGRRTAENDPLTPSRLLFACENRELPERSLRLFSRPTPLRNRVMIVDGLSPTGDGAMFAVPRPVPLPEPITSMRVTEFSAYLECPYRYYLAHQLRLKALETQAEELPPNAFGDVMHNVLEAFGKSPEIHRLTDAERIYEFLSDTLSQQTQSRFGRHPLPAVRVQIEQARLRLKGFADWQARWAFDGWEIRFAETSIKDQRAWMEVDGEKMYLNGRIDRIDVREKGGQLEVTILDYKTSDSGASPEDKHRDKEGNWTDLQLPLYRHMLSAVEGMPRCDNVRLGYIVLPKRTSEIGLKLAEWTNEDLESADETAREVIRCVRRQAFWPPNPNPRYFSEFAAICQDDLFASLLQEEGEPGH
jgi:RecB family exonuclease